MLFLKDNHGPDPGALKKRANLTIAPTTVNAKTMALACVTRAVQVLVVKSTPAPKHATTVATATAMASASVPWDGRVNRAVLGVP
jgi:homogentisate 1,2-dioxygenase